MTQIKMNKTNLDPKDCIPATNKQLSPSASPVTSTFQNNIYTETPCSLPTYPIASAPPRPTSNNEAVRFQSDSLRMKNGERPLSGQLNPLFVKYAGIQSHGIDIKNRDSHYKIKNPSAISSSATVFQKIANFFKKIFPSFFMPSISSYFDLGGLGSHLWDFIQWDNNVNGGAEVFQVASFNTYLQSLFAQMKAAGMNQIDLSFSQISCIDNYATGNYENVSSSDILAVLIKQMIDSKVYFPPNENLLSLITAAAKQAQMNVCVSFGGEAAGPTDFQICQSGETVQGQAQKLANYMEQYGIQSVDFDIEGANVEDLLTGQDAVGFFSTLHQSLQSGQKATLTIQGSLTQTVMGNATDPTKPNTFTGPLKPLFYDVNNQLIFANLFDGVNLMLYDSGSRYYLDDKVYTDDTLTPDWVLEAWLTIIGPQNAGQVNVGFQDATSYQTNASSASGHTYDKPAYQGDPLVVNPSTDSSGTAAAKIFLQMQRTLIQDGYTTQLGTPFWWPNYGDRYGHDKNFNADFVSQVMTDYYTALEQLGQYVNKQPLSIRVKSVYQNVLSLLKSLI